MTLPVTRHRFREELLSLMDRKHHWAWPAFANGTVSLPGIKHHFQQEYGVYVRDFPVFLARLHGQNPPAEVRHALAENIYEEDTGGLSLGTSHPELFLRMMEGLGFSTRDFTKIRLLPASQHYRTWLDQVTADACWIVGVATLTIFVEGSLNDRVELATPVKPKTAEDIESLIQGHPLVQHYGLSSNAMDLIRAHQLVEGGHRYAAYTMVGKYATTRLQQQAVLRALKKSLLLWETYRDGVAKICGVTRL